jgi:hypothetical protein
MTLDVFALWKFKRFEGRLKGFHASDMFVTKIEHGLEEYELTYDIKTNTATLRDNFSEKIIFECHFRELEIRLRELGLMEERTENRHSSADVPLEVKL